MSDDERTDVWTSVNDEMLERIDKAKEELGVDSRSAVLRLCLRKVLYGTGLVDSVDVKGKRHVQTWPVQIECSDFEAKMLGNRLWELSNVYERQKEDSHEDQDAYDVQELRWWARKFHEESNIRD